MLFLRSELFKKPAYSMTFVSSGHLEPSHFHEALYGLFYAGVTACNSAPCANGLEFVGPIRLDRRLLVIGAMYLFKSLSKTADRLRETLPLVRFQWCNAVHTGLHKRSAYSMANLESVQWTKK